MQLQHYMRSVHGRTLLKTLIFTILLASAVLGCTPSDLSIAGDGTSLVNTRWLLEFYRDSNGSLPVPTDPFPLLEIRQDYLVFDDGCNQVPAGYELDDERFTIKPSVIRGVNCIGVVSDEANALDSVMIYAILTWSTYELSGDKLVIDFEDGQIGFSRLIPSNLSLLRSYPLYIEDGQERTQETISVEGRIELIDGCMRFTSSDASAEASRLIIWPDYYALGLEDGMPAIYEIGYANLLATAGDTITTRGTPLEEVASSDDGSFIVHGLSQACPGPYWLLYDIQPQPGQ